MATRFSLYQNSIRKFIAGQSIITTYQFKEQLIKIMENSEFILPITLLTIMNGQQKKNKLKLVHGYEMATGIELLIILVDLLKHKKKLISTKRFNFNDRIIDSLHMSLVSLINLSFNRNIDSIKLHHEPEDIIKIFTVGSEQINEKTNKIVSSIMSLEFPEGTKKISKSELKKFHFKNTNVNDQVYKIKSLPRDFIIKYTDNTFGNICKLSLILGWIIGGSPHDMINNLDRLGHHLGILLKIAYDFENIDDDIETCLQNNLSLNYVVNFGLQESFELFDESKKKFNEGLLTLGITSPTIKEFLDILENKVNIALDNSSPHIKKTSSMSS
jgi:hypothetical protein